MVGLSSLRLFSVTGSVTEIDEAETGKHLLKSCTLRRRFRLNICKPGWFLANLRLMGLTCQQVL